MRIEVVLFLGIFTPGENVSLERKIESSIFPVYTPRSEYSGEELYHFCDSEYCSEFVPWT